jgi:tetratricopeptide (TPR) repeat protein
MDHEAKRLFQAAYAHQMRGELAEAVRLYQASLALEPTAEAHTFLGWTYSFQGDLARAIEECRAAIRIDPEFGNPYNDIGAYLIELGRLDEAVPWLERATRAARYDNPEFPHLNLGRVHEAKGELVEAARHYAQAVAIAPRHELAGRALGRVRGLLN